MTFNIDLGSVFIATCGFSIALFQLHKIQKQLEIAIENQRVDSLQVVLEIETQMNSRKLEFDKASKQIRLADLENMEDAKFGVLEDYFNSIKESYFNSIDRLCYCIEKEYIKDKDWRTEYRNMLKDTISAYPGDFDEASPYNNLKRLNRKWQET